MVSAAEPAIPGAGLLGRELVSKGGQTTGGKGPGLAPQGRMDSAGIVGRFDVRRRLFLPLGAVEFQNRVESDFAHALLDGANRKADSSVATETSE